MPNSTFLTFPLGMNRTNCYFLINASSCVIIDPAFDAEFLCNKLKEKNLKLEMILLTHAHFDHIMALDELRDATSAPVYLHFADWEILTSAEHSYLSFVGRTTGMRAADEILADGDILRLGDERIEVIHTPGHTPGSCCFVAGTDVFCGDTIFASGYGRCDLYGGCDELMRGSLDKLNRRFEGTEYRFHPGHGNSFKFDGVRRI